MANVWSALVRKPVKKLANPPPASVTRHEMSRIPPGRPHLVAAPPPPPPPPIVAATSGPLIRAQPAPPPPPPVAPEFDVNPWRLTSTQWKVMLGISHSRSRQAIAEELGICSNTVDVHLSRVRERMRVATTTAAIAAFLRVNQEIELEKRRVKSEAMLIERLKPYAR